MEKPIVSAQYSHAKDVKLLLAVHMFFNNSGTNFQLCQAPLVEIDASKGEGGLFERRIVKARLPKKAIAWLK